jgi:hypothetical protein
MDKAEAKGVLAKELEVWRTRSYSDLLEFLDRPTTKEVLAESGIKYQIEIQVFWDDKPNGNLRVLGSIDDGGWRAFAPMSNDFILAPDGSFVGE